MERRLFLLGFVLLFIGVVKQISSFHDQREWRDGESHRAKRILTTTPMKCDSNVIDHCGVGYKCDEDSGECQPLKSTTTTTEPPRTSKSSQSTTHTTPSKSTTTTTEPPRTSKSSQPTTDTTPSNSFNTTYPTTSKTTSSAAFKFRNWIQVCFVSLLLVSTFLLLPQHLFEILSKATAYFWTFPFKR